MGQPASPMTKALIRKEKEKAQAQETQEAEAESGLLAKAADAQGNEKKSDEQGLFHDVAEEAI